MKLLVPGRSCVAGGVEKLCLSLFPELVRLGVEVVWAVPEHRLEELSRGDGVRLVSVDWPPGSWRRGLSALARRVGFHWLFDLLYMARIRSLRAETGATHELYTWVINEPLPADDFPRIMLALDRNWVHFPENFDRPPEVLDAILERWMCAMRNVVAISREVAREISERWPEFDGKIHAIPLAASVRPWPTAQVESSGLNFYYPASAGAHKGHATLFAAMRLLRDRGIRARVVLSGHGTDALAKENADLTGQGLLSGMGYASAAEVDAAYQGAAAVVLPSHYEGFGLPLAEALAHGVPLICSDLPPYLEQITQLGAQEFATVVPKGDAVALAAAMQARLSAASVSEADRSAMRGCAQKWTWSDVAKAWQTLLSNTP